jgi:hypothetical protein
VDGYATEFSRQLGLSQLLVKWRQHMVARLQLPKAHKGPFKLTRVCTPVEVGVFPRVGLTAKRAWSLAVQSSLGPITG